MIACDERRVRASNSEPGESGLHAPRFGVGTQIDSCKRLGYEDWIKESQSAEGPSKVPVLAEPA